METVQIDTALYDDVVVERSDHAVSAYYVSKPAVRATFTRIGPRTHDKTPLGTRYAALVDGEFDGRPMSVQVGRARVTKASYRVRMAFQHTTLTLAAKDLESSALIRGDSDGGDNCYGDLTREYGGGVSVFWGLPFGFAGRTIEPPTPSENEVLVGVAAAAAFGTGGLSLTTIVMSLLSSAFP
ncbi:hypothetical protein CH275_20290 [Rhodococcus sp. 06-235-1A]|uniref:hypothetical protein n=1 Tax=Rhodococcus sp. 06-235-1A TaxID=2022508 RepID=UPI000B9A772D|nr:hypothetical protein [Rhodococcus sp. 06-235-1A]OZD01090.1 hypothetical protein CH275_20290 [Rhodococcus sp. 06-235-1A]